MNRLGKPILLTCIAVWCIHTTILLLVRCYQPKPLSIFKPPAPIQNLIEIVSLPAPNSTIPKVATKIDLLDLPNLVPAKISQTDNSEIPEIFGEIAHEDSDNSQENVDLAVDQGAPNYKNDGLEYFPGTSGSTLKLASDPGSAQPSDIILAQRRQGRATRPIFKFKPINEYASAQDNGNSAFSNYSTSNRQPNKTDFIILDYQERIRKHFNQSFNAFANKTTFNIPENITARLEFTINKAGEVTNIQINCPNPVIIKLIKKILEYTGKFPPIPKTVELDYYPMSFSISMPKGTLSDGYRWR